MVNKKFFYLLFIFSLNSHALFLFNPYIGKSKGEFNDGTNKGDVSANHYGAHLALQADLLTLGLDLTYSVNDYDRNFKNGNQSEYKGYEWGLLTGIGTQGMRAWFAYNLNSQRMPEGTDGYYFGTNFKIGLGIKVAGDVFLNLESFKAIYDEQEVDNGPTTKLGQNIKNEGFILTISVPTYF